MLRVRRCRSPPWSSQELLDRPDGAFEDLLALLRVKPHLFVQQVHGSEHPAHDAPQLARRKGEGQFAGFALAGELGVGQAQQQDAPELGNGSEEVQPVRPLGVQLAQVAAALGDEKCPLSSPSFRHAVGKKLLQGNRLG